MESLNRFFAARISNLTKRVIDDVFLKTDLYRQVEYLSRSESLSYINKFRAVSFLYPTREELWEYAIESSVRQNRDFDLQPLTVVELGVFEGKSLSYLEELLAKEMKKLRLKEFSLQKLESLGEENEGIRYELHGFDTFLGLAEDWRRGMKKGSFNLGGEGPAVSPRIIIHKGEFEETIPRFLSTKKYIDLFHFDVDTYESTRKSLLLLDDYLKSGSIVIFDEYYNQVGWKFGEFCAWQEYVESRKIRYEYLAFGPTQALIQIV